MTRDEFVQSRDGDMIDLTCENHPSLVYSCKKIALTKDINGKYRYNGRRSIFFKSRVFEKCDCPVSTLYALIGD